MNDITDNNHFNSVKYTCGIGRTSESIKKMLFYFINKWMVNEINVQNMTWFKTWLKTKRDILNVENDHTIHFIRKIINI